MDSGVCTRGGRWEVGGGVCGEAYTEPANHGHSHRHAGMEREDGGAGKPKPTPLYERTYTCITTGGDR